MPTFSILVLSDLHMHHGDTEGGAPSYLSSKPSLNSPTRNPLAGIGELLRAAGIRPDWILCPGDLGDRCDELAQSQAWQALQRLKHSIHARRLIGTVGNHDVDSRRNDRDRRPNDFVMALEPLFPTSPRTSADRYWRQNFFYLEHRDADLNLLVVNSCAFHGVVAAANAEDEFKHGRISLDTITQISETVQPRLKRRNLLLVHHHIRQHPWLPGEVSHMENGPALLDALRNTGYQWLVIHGHQHLPNLSYAEGGALAPAVFSAGSVAAQTTVLRGRHPRNQLYCIQFDLDAPPTNEIYGHIKAWDWYPHVGWQLASRESGLPHSCGFGYRGSLGDLADRIVALALQTSHRYVRWNEVSGAIGEVNYLIPDDVETLVQRLQDRDATVDYDRWGVPSAVGARREVQ